MTIQHVDITDPQIHEPKGVSSASVGTVYVADGSGSGDWQYITLDSLDPVGLYAEIQDQLNSGDLEVTGRLFLTATIADLSETDGCIVPIGHDCTVVGATLVLGGTIDGDTQITFRNSSGAGMGPSVLLIADGSIKGTLYTWEATGNNEVVGPSWFEAVSDGGTSTSVPLWVTFEIVYTLNEGPGA